MQKKIKNSCYIFLVITLFCFLGFKCVIAEDLNISFKSVLDESKTLENISNCGILSVKNTQLVNNDGVPVQLKGISTHGLAWFSDYINEECFRELKEEWGINVIRLAMYTGESGGYCTDGDKENLKSLIQKGVEYATKYNMYVIIDWHILSDGNPNIYIDEAKVFFDEMSKTYANHTNVLYEICNEPNGGTLWKDIKSYAETIIPIIRKNDENAIILVGTPNWCQFVEQAAENPINGFENIMYTLHFYASTHTDILRSAMVKAIEKGLPIFVSEYGICDATGNGMINIQQANEWIHIMNDNKISYVLWNLSNKDETSAILKSDCKKLNGFTKDDLSDSGKWLYEMLMDTSIMEMDKTENFIINNEFEKDNNNLKTIVNIINSWNQNNKYYYQYNIKLINNTEYDTDNWTTSLKFNRDVILVDSWNGNFSNIGDTITISAMDYNSNIKKDNSIENIGFIICANEQISFISY